MKVKYGCIILLLAWVAGACSKDDDGDGFGNDDRFNRRKVSRIYSDSGLEPGYDLKFTYDEKGEIKKIVEIWSEKDEQEKARNEYEFTFTDHAISVSGNNDDRGNSFTVERPLNEQRYVSRCTTGYHTYDQEGHLLTTGRDTLVWKNGNLVGGNEPTEIELLEYKYTNKENKANIDFSVALFYSYDRPDSYYSYLDALGYYGKNSRNLLESTCWCTYTYKYDKEGYVIQITETATPDNYDFDGAYIYKVEYYK